MTYVNRFEIVRIVSTFRRACDTVELTEAQLEGLDMDQFRVQTADCESDWGDGDRHDGLESILEATVFASPIEHPLYEDAPFDGVDYTGVEAGMHWDGTEDCAWHTRYSSVAQCPELLNVGVDVEDGGEEATWSAKRGGYDRPDMMGIDWAWLASDASSRPARAYVYRPGVGYTDRGRMRGRKNSGRRQSSYISRFGEGYSAEVAEQPKAQRSILTGPRRLHFASQPDIWTWEPGQQAQYGSFTDLWPAIRAKRLAGILNRRKGLPKTQPKAKVVQLNPRKAYWQAKASGFIGTYHQFLQA